MDTPSYTDFSSAEDFFEAVRQASREAERTRLTLLQMEAREGVRAQGYEPRYSRWSRRSLRDMCQRGFDRIDSLGWERAIEGVGDAT